MIPTLVDGATLESLVTARIRLSGVRFAREEFGRLSGAKYRRQLQNPFGFWAGELATNAFDGLVAPIHLVLRHSFTPIFTAQLKKSDADLFVNNCIRGADRTVFHGWYPKRWQGCRHCLSEDLELYGISHWRVLHQLPGVATCARHGSTLFHRCGSCGEDLAPPLAMRLPGDTCSNCGFKKHKRETARPSAGQKALVALYGTLLAGTGPRLSRDCWNRFDLQKTPDLAETFTTDLLDFFDCSTTADLREVLGCPDIDNSIVKLLWGGPTLNKGACVFAVAAMLMEMGKGLRSTEIMS